MSTVRCSRSYHNSKVDFFPVFAGGVRDGIFDNPQTFATPPFTFIDFNNLLDNYNNKRYLYEQGGKSQRGPYRDAKAALMAKLDELANYVDGVANGNANIITLAGFVATKQSRSKSVRPDEPTGVVLTRGKKGILIAECDPQDQSVHFGCILTAHKPLPSSVILTKNGQLQIIEDVNDADSKNAQLEAANIMVTALIDLKPQRKKEFTNLKPGVTYFVVYYASNSAGVSPFSLTVSIMCA